MDQCCEIRTNLPGDQRRVLQIVLWLNGLMFLAELGAGLAAHSTALLADSVDMFGDAIVYGFSLYAVAHGVMWQARVALLKGLIMAAFGLGVLIEVSHKLIAGVVPAPGLMTIVGLIALGANAVCLLLLSRHRGDDINMRSAWLCSRNDVIANAGVLIAAGGVALTGSGWPDNFCRTRHRDDVRYRCHTRDSRCSPAVEVCLTRCRAIPSPEQIALME